MVYDKAVDHIYCHMSTMSDHGIDIVGYKLRNFQLFHLLLTVMFMLNNEEVKLKFMHYCVCQVQPPSPFAWFVFLPFINRTVCCSP